jgi:hypothetical protein
MTHIGIRQSLACSMFKITGNGKTMVGNNEDSWRLTPKIWFENGTQGNLGVAYVGYEEKIGMEGAVNEAGLAFDGFLVKQKGKYDYSRPNAFDNPTGLLKIIMQTCRNVEDVKKALEPYDYYFFRRGMLLFVDSTGKYLVVEPDTLVEGNDPKYVLSNFCPSITHDLNEVKIKRYRRGVKFLEGKSVASLETSVGMMDTMHECRAKIGDGTLYTTIYDLNEGKIYLYFYHDYKRKMQFDLKKELAKGDHTFKIPALFPPNEEFVKLCQFLTPFNSPMIRNLLVFFGLLFLMSILVFIVKYFRSRKANSQIIGVFRFVPLLFIVMDSLLLYYIVTLFLNHPIFYFPAPYKDVHFSFLNIAAFFPLALLLLILPVGYLSMKAISLKSNGIFIKILFTLNFSAYLILVILFWYWGLLVIL